MKRVASLAVYVVAVLALQLTSMAQDRVPQIGRTPVGVPRVGVTPLAVPQAGDLQPGMPAVGDYQADAPQAGANDAGTSQEGVSVGGVPQIGSTTAIPGLVPSPHSLTKFAAKRTGEAKMPTNAFNGYAFLRQSPDLGAPGSAGNGFHHFPAPMDKFTSWYRPKAATLTQYQRCAPEPFRPRGFGNLFAVPCDGFRMDYEPYALSDGMSNYGPAYLARMPDPRCPDCDHTADDDECRECRKR
jgi:hypothetical protein